jgi:hypothetical protein
VVDVVLVLVLMGRAKSTRLHVVFRGNVVPQLDSASGQSDEEQSSGILVSVYVSWMFTINIILYEYPIELK